MSTERVLRHDELDQLVDDIAEALTRTVLELQKSQEVVNIGLSGGVTANRVYERFAEVAPNRGMRSESIRLWWSDDCFLPTSDPQRNALQALAILARTLPISRTETHPMPGSDGQDDPDEAAFAYARDLGETVLDICLLGLGTDGHVAGLFPGRVPSDASSSQVVGITDAPSGCPERISLSYAALNRCERIWVVASGEHKAEALARSLAKDPDSPASHLDPRGELVWWIDEDAALALPTYHCEL